MVVDSSVVIAMLRMEPGWETLRETLLFERRRIMSAPTLVEAGMVMEGRLGAPGGHDLDRLIREVRIEIIPFDADQAALARDAFRRFGKGRHPAGLNFGDCLSYALARHLDEPLLSVGEDFARTDLVAALE